MLTPKSLISNAIPSIPEWGDHPDLRGEFLGSLAVVGGSLIHQGHACWMALAEPVTLSYDSFGDPYRQFASISSYQPDLDYPLRYRIDKEDVFRLVQMLTQAGIRFSVDGIPSDWLAGPVDDDDEDDD